LTRKSGYLFYLNRIGKLYTTVKPLIVHFPLFAIIAVVFIF
jgi:hypothetical protein